MPDISIILPISAIYTTLEATITQGHAYVYNSPVDCVWDVWGNWTVCSEQCGGGQQSRTRTQLRLASNGGEECTGDHMQEQKCNTGGCLGKLEHPGLNCWAACGEMQGPCLYCGSGYCCKKGSYKILVSCFTFFQ